MEKNLEDQFQYSVDSQDMGRVIEELPEMLRKGREIGSRGGATSLKGPVSSIAFLGMGGSGIAGELISSLFGDAVPFPIWVIRDYKIPSFLGKDTLFFAVSYSGDTEETLESCSLALERGGQVVAVTSGGRLSSISQEKGFPLLRIPAGFQPRAALGFLFGASLSYLENLGFFGDLNPMWEETFSLLENLKEVFSPKTPVEENPAKKLALQALDKEIVIFSSPGITNSAALRWKAQLNENSKLPALVDSYPELDHNTLVALSFQKRDIYLITLRDLEEHPRISLRIRFTTEIIQPQISGCAEIHSQGKSRLARLFSLLYFGDFLSWYLALARGVDPTPVEVIKELKNRMARGA
ncbi:MAG: bifunctional phosphoglucose/phosphomannose isomerase [Caldiserica bacterium]|nr:bifunctional phosphoglucose/phosphomannose isomerase [Caldisericota bacterium]MDH7561931.1 bifunctional phosphoglucose/phosphomannose isomerase [Caldisericota bacterium]